MKNHLILIVGFFLLLGCQDEVLEADPVGVGYNFFPLNLGDFRIYDVEEITYSSQGPEMNSFQMRTEVVDTFQNQAGGITYVISELRRDTPSDEWEFVQTNSARLTETQAMFADGNVSFLKLSFPISAGKTWDANALNSMDEDLVEMDSLFVPYITSAGDSIPETLTVILEDNQDVIVNLVRSYEIYGLDIGLVYFEEIDRFFCVEETCLGQQIIEEGTEIRQTLIAYGTDL